MESLHSPVPRGLQVGKLISLQGWPEMSLWRRDRKVWSFVSPWLAMEPSILCSTAHPSCKFSGDEKLSIIYFVQGWNTQGQIFSLTIQFRNCMDGSRGTVLDLSPRKQIWLHTHNCAVNKGTVSQAACSILSYQKCTLSCPGKILYSIAKLQLYVTEAVIPT